MAGRSRSIPLLISLLALFACKAQSANAIQMNGNTVTAEYRKAASGGIAISFYSNNPQVDQLKEWTANSFSIDKSGIASNFRHRLGYGYDDSILVSDNLVPNDMLHTCAVKSLDRILGAEEISIIPPDNKARIGNVAIHKEQLLGGPIGSFWQNGETLRVRFLNGDPRVQSRVAAIASEWSRYVNVKFAFVNEGESDIRISIYPNNYPNGKGSWSAIGTDARRISSTEPTMNYGWLTPDTSEQEYRRVVLHEFGHALGFNHEHQSPAGGILWNRDKAFAYYSKMNGWDAEKVEMNVFQSADASQTRYSNFDPKSIMLYPIPTELTLNGFSSGNNSELSDNDKIFAGEVYPFTSYSSSIEGFPTSGGSVPVGAADPDQYVEVYLEGQVTCNPEEIDNQNAAKQRVKRRALRQLEGMRVLVQGDWVVSPYTNRSCFIVGSISVLDGTTNLPVLIGKLYRHGDSEWRLRGNTNKVYRLKKLKTFQAMEGKTVIMEARPPSSVDDVWRVASYRPYPDGI